MQAAIGGVLQKKMFLKILQNPQENTHSKKEIPKQVFSCEFCKIFKKFLSGCFWNV